MRHIPISFMKAYVRRLNDAASWEKWAEAKDSLDIYQIMAFNVVNESYNSDSIRIANAFRNYISLTEKRTAILKTWAEALG